MQVRRARNDAAVGQKKREEKFIDKFERDNEVKLKKIEIRKSVTELL